MRQPPMRMPGAAARQHPDIARASQDLAPTIRQRLAQARCQRCSMGGSAAGTTRPGALKTVIIDDESRNGFVRRIVDGRPLSAPSATDVVNARFSSPAPWLIIMAAGSKRAVDHPDQRPDGPSSTFSLSSSASSYENRPVGVGRRGVSAYRNLEVARRHRRTLSRQPRPATRVQTHVGWAGARLAVKSLPPA